MMRRPKWPPVGQPAIRQFAGDRGHHRHFKQLARSERRQDRRQTLRQHRLAGAGWAGHQQVVPASSRDLKRSPRGFLALDVSEVGQKLRGAPDHRFRPRQDLRAAEMIGDADQAARRQYVDLRTRPCRLGAGCMRADQALALGIGAHRGRQSARDFGDCSVQPQFAQHDVAAQRIAGDRAKRRHQAKGDRQIVMTSLLGKIGRRQIDGHLLGRHRQAGSMQRRLNPLAAFGHRLVGQSDNVEYRVE